MEARYLWRWFVELMDGAVTGFGPAIITWSDVNAWSDLTRIRPEPWEARTLVRLSALRAQIIGEQMEAASRKARHGPKGAD